MTTDLNDIYSALVTIKSKLIGSGVLVNLGDTEHSFVITAKHNIDNENFKVYDSQDNELESEIYCHLDELDISIIKIGSYYKSEIKLYYHDDIKPTSHTTSWILGFPKALSKSPAHKKIAHQGEIALVNNRVEFIFSENLPIHADRDNVDGFSGGPIFCKVGKETHLKGIITDSFDNDFNYKRITGVSLERILSAFHSQMPSHIVNSVNLEHSITKSCNRFDDKITQYLIKHDGLNKLFAIDIKKLQHCKYLYLPDDKSSCEQYQSLLINDESLQAYIHSRIISIIIGENVNDIIINPINTENNKIFTIHVTNYKETYSLVAKLIRQEHSIEYDNSFLFIIHSSKDNDLSYVSKKKVSRILSDYSQGKTPDLYDTSATAHEKLKIGSFLDSMIKANVKFSIININVLVKAISAHIENELYNEPYSKESIEEEIIKVMERYE